MVPTYDNTHIICIYITILYHCYTTTTLILLYILYTYCILLRFETAVYIYNIVVVSVGFEVVKAAPPPTPGIRMNFFHNRKILLNFQFAGLI